MNQRRLAPGIVPTLEHPGPVGALRHLPCLGMLRTSLPTLAVLGGLLALGAGCGHTATGGDVATGGSSAANPPAAAGGQDPAGAPSSTRGDTTTAHSQPPKAPS